MNDEEMTKLVLETNQRAKSNTHQIEDLKRRQDNLDDLVSSVAVFAKEQEHIQQDVREIKSDVKALTDKPARRWDGLVDKILLVLAGAFAAWLMAGGTNL